MKLRWKHENGSLDEDKKRFINDNDHYYKYTHFISEAKEILPRLDKRGNKGQHENLSHYPSISE